MKYLMILASILLVSCVSTPELTSAEVTEIHQSCSGEAVCIINTTDAAIAAKVAQLEYEREDRRLVKRDKLIVFLNSCDADKDLVILEIIRLGRSKLPNEFARRKALREYGYKYTHDNVHSQARMYDFKCVDPDDILRQVEGF